MHQEEKKKNDHGMQNAQALSPTGNSLGAGYYFRKIKTKENIWVPSMLRIVLNLN